MPNNDKYKREKRGYPYLSEKDAEGVTKAEDDFVEHYSDPNTRRLFPGTQEELDKGIQEALSSRIQTGNPGYGAAASYEEGYTRGYREDGTYGPISPDDPAYEPGTITLGTGAGDQSTIAHELSHAAGFDDQLGQQLQGILGKLPGKSKKERYLNRPGELYGNFHQVRTKLGIKPWERSFTPEKLQELIEFTELGEDEDVKTYIENFGLEKMSEALNTVANVEADQRRLDRLNFDPSDNVIVRKSNTYA